MIQRQIDWKDGGLYHVLVDKEDVKGKRDFKGWLMKLGPLR